ERFPAARQSKSPGAPRTSPARRTETHRSGGTQAKGAAVSERGTRRLASEARAEALARKVYSVVLRERFLDKNMDVKVHVSGKQYDRITLEWVLFSDVWTHKMAQADGLLPEMKTAGFRRVDVTNGYDYHVYWGFSKDE